MDIKAVFLHCCPDCPSCLAHLDSTGWVAWPIRAAIMKYGLNLILAAKLLMAHKIKRSKHKCLQIQSILMSRTSLQRESSHTFTHLHIKLPPTFMAYLTYLTVVNFRFRLFLFHWGGRSIG